MHTASGVVSASTKSPCLVSPPFPCRTLIPLLSTRAFPFQHKRMLNVCLSSHTCKDEISCVRKQPNGPEQEDLRKQPNGPEQEYLRSRRSSLLFLISSGLYASSPPVSAKTKTKSPYDEKRLLEQNRKIQEANNAPSDFPSFIREGFQVKVVLSDSYVKRDSGLIYLDVEVGKGDCPTDGQQVTFHYVGYNESGRRIDSTYLQGSPAKIRLGTNSLVPGFEEGIQDMRPGGKRRLIIPPELGPPVGPSTFFSSKQFEVFDVELLSIQSCQRRTVAFYSDVVCT